MRNVGIGCLATVLLLEVQRILFTVRCICQRELFFTFHNVYFPISQIRQFVT